MNKLVIIPVHEFADMLKRIVEFYKQHLEECDIVIINDSKVLKKCYIGALVDTKAKVINSKSNRNLAGNILQAFDFAKESFGKEYDLIITNEHDVMPTVDALYACLSVFENKKVFNGFASVSTLYKWNNEICYPTSKDWLNGWSIQNIPLVGDARVIGKQGVPFGFALWKPEAINQIREMSFDGVLYADTKFGEFLYKRGYHHIRLINYHVEHFNKGVKSWRI